MDRILPETLSAPIALAIEKVYAYGPMAEKTVVLGKRKVLLVALNMNIKSFTRLFVVTITFYISIIL